MEKTQNLVRVTRRVTVAEVDAISEAKWLHKIRKVDQTNAPVKTDTYDRHQCIGSDQEAALESKEDRGRRHALEDWEVEAEEGEAVIAEANLRISAQEHRQY